MVVFEPSSVYGVREGYHSGLLVTAQDKGNVFWRSPVYKNGVVSGVTMLPRILCYALLETFRLFWLSVLGNFSFCILCG